MAGGMPLWREIAQSLEQRIRSRELHPGDKLPTEYELSRQFMVNRHTVRRALSDLQEKGIVESTQGRGSFVRRPTRPAQLQRRPRFTEAVLSRGAEPTTKVLKLEVRPADSRVAEALELKTGAPVIFMERVRFVDGEPTGLGLHHFSFERFPTFVEMYRTRGTITQTLRDSGVPDYTRRRTVISARLPTAPEADLLHVPRHVPLLIRRYVNVDGLGRPLEFGESRTSNEIEIVFPAPGRD
ncbi:phosphonate metabolism transcriptional regulator PhnF [Phenylobacterium sp.]|uniref:phosphonate metabolism transcriptional regulator PhnF n=1 Tax=Phenylobacterium sp. TaxID=1871053 RepID=UPI002FD9C2DA